MASDRNHNKMYEYLIKKPICEICNMESASEVHHIIPLSVGGTDDETNYISLCFGCHANEHNHNAKYSKEKLIQFGIYKNRYFKKDVESNRLFSRTDLYHILNYYCIKREENIDVIDILNIIDDLPSYGFVDEATLNKNYEGVIDWLQRM